MVSRRQFLFQFFVAFFNDHQSLVVDVVFLRFYRTGTTEKTTNFTKKCPFFAENIYTDLEEEVLEVEVTPELEESCSSANRTFRWGELPELFIAELLTFLRLLTRAYVSDSEQAGEELWEAERTEAGISGNGGVTGIGGGGPRAAAFMVVNCCCGFLGKIRAYWSDALSTCK